MKQLKTIKTITFIITLTAIMFIGINVNAETKLQCSYKGVLPSYDDNPVEVAVTIKLDGSAGGDATFTSSTALAQDILDDIDAPSCKTGGDYNQCIFEVYKIFFEGDAEQARDYIEAHNLKVTFGDDENDLGNNIVNILTTDASGKYIVLKENKEKYFVKDNKYSCPDSLVVLSRSSISEDSKKNYSFYIDNSGFDSSKCSSNSIGNYLCEYSSVFTKYDNPLIETIETKYDDGIISDGYNNCCAYYNSGTVNPVYVYSFPNGTGNNTYSVCYGVNCMTLSPLANHVINSSEWDSYHSLGSCSNMPSKIYFTYNGNVYEKSLDTTIKCSAPTTEPSNVNKNYEYTTFYPSKEAMDNSISTDYEIDFGDPVEVNCEGILGNDLIDYLDKLFGWVKISVPIILIVFGCVDFGQAILSDDKDVMKKATSKFVKRCIVAIIIFFLPTLLTFLLRIFNSLTTDGGISVCGIG